MSSTEKLDAAISNSRDMLLAACAQAKERAAIGRENEEKANRINEELKQLRTTKEVFLNCMNYMVKIYKNIEKYASDREKLSLEMLKLAISKAGYIVPDADVNGIELKVTDGSAKIVNRFGQDVNLREGSAYRAVMGILIKYTLIKSKPEAVQAIFLDEAFTALSDATTVSMREYINAFKEDILIVGIEQRSVMFEGLDPVVYVVTKGDDKITTIRREE